MRTCRVCGCDDEHACATIEGPCTWVEPDLCSACVAGGPLKLGADSLAALEAGWDRAMDVPAREERRIILPGG